MLHVCAHHRLLCHELCNSIGVDLVRRICLLNFDNDGVQMEGQSHTNGARFINKSRMFMGC
jgi:hypothetical protein